MYPARKGFDRTARKLDNGQLCNNFDLAEFQSQERAKSVSQSCLFPGCRQNVGDRRRMGGISPELWMEGLALK